MSPHHPTHLPAAIVGGVALFVIGALAAGCGTTGHQPVPTTTSTTSPASSAPPVPPTEKSISPTGGNLFTPDVKAPAAPTVRPGLHPGINGVP